MTNSGFLFTFPTFQRFIQMPETGRSGGQEGSSKSSEELRSCDRYERGIGLAALQLKVSNSSLESELS